MRLGFGLALGILAMSANGCDSAGASPNQPIAFPHQSHTENQIECGFCHEYTDSHAAAGLPETELCGTCHQAMSQDSEATQKLMEFVEQDAPIPWVRLYELPGFTHFNHKRHIRADVSCSECHGDIGTSRRAERHQVLDMEWCIGCHEQRDASVDCVTCHI